MLLFLAVKRLLLGLILLLCACLRSFPEEPILPEEEAPEAIFQSKIGDADVDFFLTGSWRAHLYGSFDILFKPDGASFIYPSAFPGLGVDQPFQQFPDLTFSVWLMERYFVEASIVDLSEDFFQENYFRMGYQGKEGEFLHHVYIANREITIPSYRFLDIPEQGINSLGVEAQMESGASSHHLLLRSDNNEPGSLTFIGKNLVTEEVIPLDAYVQGRFFKLPDIAVENLEVYLEDPEGSYTGDDGYKYRKATLDDAVLNSAGGLVTLKAEAQGRRRVKV